MGLTVIVGGFFGDEGKGKVCSYLSISDNPDVLVRTGGINAGHTVVYNGTRWKLRIVPSGFFNRKSKLRIAAGALFSIETFKKEISETNVTDRIKVDGRCGIITYEHVRREHDDKYLSLKIGSTKQGVGAAMADRVLRRLKLARDFEELKPYITDVAMEVNEVLDSGGKVLVEGTQGLYLSLIHGDYPYVTSRDTSACGVLSEVGIGPKKVNHVIVVFKSYVTRVGEGRLPGELTYEEAKRRRMLEIATVTGRVRRAAPFNVELARRAVIINSATQVAITKLDTLYPEAKGVREWNKLPRDARLWIEDLESKLKVPITLIGTGEEVSCIIDRRAEYGLEV